MHLVDTLTIGMDAFVKADRCLQPALKGRMVHDVVPMERLLDQEKPKIVQGLEDGHIVQGVGRVGVDLQRAVGPGPP